MHEGAAVRAHVNTGSDSQSAATSPGNQSALSKSDLQEVRMLSLVIIQGTKQKPL